MKKHGKTERMIRELVLAIKQGQPKFVIVIHNSHYLSHLRRRVLQALAANGERVVLDAVDHIIVDSDQEICFETAARIGAFQLGRSGWGEFWDCPHTDYAAGGKP